MMTGGGLINIIYYYDSKPIYPILLPLLDNNNLALVDNDNAVLLDNGT